MNNRPFPRKSPPFPSRCGPGGGLGADTTSGKPIARHPPIARGRLVPRIANPLAPSGACAPFAFVPSQWRLRWYMPLAPNRQARVLAPVAVGGRGLPRVRSYVGLPGSQPPCRHGNGCGASLRRPSAGVVTPADEYVSAADTSRPRQSPPFEKLPSAADNIAASRAESRQAGTPNPPHPHCKPFQGLKGLQCYQRQWGPP